MSKLKIHSGTLSSEIINFVEENKGKKIELHYECNMGDFWGYDDIAIFDTSLEKDYKILIDMIHTHCIHNIQCIN